MNKEKLRDARVGAEQASWREDPASPEQIRYVKSLVEEREVPEHTLLGIKAMVEKGLKKGQASTIIGDLKKLPQKDPRNYGGVVEDRTKNRPTIADIPPGRYCVKRSHDVRLNDLDFYRVKEAGRLGHKYLLRISGPNEHPVSGEERMSAIKRIVRAGIGESASLYGHKIGRCSKCHLRLTNRISREIGTGPICGGRYYEERWEEVVERARQAVLARGEDPDEPIDWEATYGRAQTDPNYGETDAGW